MAISWYGSSIQHVRNTLVLINNSYALRLTHPALSPLTQSLPKALPRGRGCSCINFSMPRDGTLRIDLRYRGTYSAPPSACAFKGHENI
jgi:hypothetical protein